MKVELKTKSTFMFYSFITLYEKLKLKNFLEGVQNMALYIIWYLYPKFSVKVRIMSKILIYLYIPTFTLKFLHLRVYISKYFFSRFLQLISTF